GLAAARATAPQLRRVLGRFDAAVARRRDHEVALAPEQLGALGQRTAGIHAIDGCSPAMRDRLIRLVALEAPGPW
ncbi:MAG: hypothetical protein RID91_08815, partial [Azospirillaceae bacterium]